MFMHVKSKYFAIVMMNITILILCDINNIINGDYNLRVLI